VKPLCRVVKKKPFVGFRNGKKHYFVQLVFENLAMWRRAKYGSKHTLYEAALDPLIKFFHVSGVPAAGWVSITGAHTEILDDAKISRPHVTELKVESYRGIERGPSSLDNETPPLVICSWDIEAFSESGAFPDSSKPSDKVITIGAVYARFGDPTPIAQSVHVLGTANPIDGVDVYTYDREEDLITGFMMETVRRRTDLLLAWNSYGFDHSYLDGRAVTLIDDQTGKSLLDMTVWSKTKDPEAGKLLEKQLASSAYGDNTYRYHNTPGIISVDALQIFRKETKHDSYTLDNIAKHYLDISKIDLKPWEMFAKFREADPTGRTEIAEYCVRDCLLPIQLVHKMNMLNGLIEFSKVTHVPIDWLLLRGQQIRVYSLICKAARDKDYLVPDMQQSSGDDLGFTGAVVLDPKSGGYTQDIVCAMDFASLYPSIMMAHNMCGSTLVIDPQYAYCTGVDYYEIEAAPGVKVRFAQTTDNVIPGLLYDLKALRKQAKRDMATADNDFTKGLLNSRQLAYKLVMNSLYGALGSNHGLLCGLKKISMSVTATGRWMIHETKRLVETLNPGSKVVYGDSVAAWTPITIRTSTGIDIVTFEDLAARVTWVPRGDGKEVAYHDGLEIWSDQGWTSVRAIIRHQHTDPLVRVATHTGVVDVTAHHSLVRPNGEMVKPTDLSIGDALMHADGPHIPQETLESLATQKITGHVAAATVFRALRSAGHHVTISSCTGDTYTVSTRSRHDNDTCIQSMTEIPYHGYVYDVTTDNHHFAAGVGDLVVHNTDSVLCILNCGEEHRQDLNEHFRVAEDLAEQITKHFLPPHELEMEKAYFPYLLVTKKRYAGLMYERPDGTPKIDIKGLQLVRRDSPKLVKRISHGMLEILLHERSFEKALVYVQNQILDMLQDRVPFEEYVMSKSLRSNYKNTNLPHLVVSRKRVSRGGTPFHSGERVPFVYTRTETEMDLGISQRAEDADYARDNNIPIDTLYYIKNQVLTPLVTLLQLHYKHAEGEILNHAEIASHMVRLQALTSRLVQKSKRVRTNTSNNQREITSFFKRDP
jgi:DNA polymerase delta subunit 1